jgi:hypothetical protein
MFAALAGLSSPRHLDTIAEWFPVSIGIFTIDRADDLYMCICWEWQYMFAASLDIYRSSALPFLYMYTLALPIVRTTLNLFGVRSPYHLARSVHSRPDNRCVHRASHRLHLCLRSISMVSISSLSQLCNTLSLDVTCCLLQHFIYVYPPLPCSITYTKGRPLLTPAVYSVHV